MKNMTQKISSVLLICISTTFIVYVTTGCKKFVEIPPPKTELQTSSTFSSSITANAAILGIYSRMVNDRGFTYRISQLTGLASDEQKNYSTGPDLLSFYTNSVTAQNGYISGDLWNQAYDYIYNANSIIEGVNGSTELLPELKNQLIGEAKFMRAFWHFYLTNLFGDVPIVTSTDYTLNASASRKPVSQVYEQIIADLKEAQVLLSENFVGVDGLKISSERVRPNKWAATALLARTYLYTNNDWQRAESEATNLINNSSFKLTSLDSVFLKNSTETIWSLQPAPSGSFSTAEGANYILTTNPGTSSINSTTVSSDMLNAFESNDNRKTKWIGDYSGYKFPNKYKVFSSTSLKEYSIVLRLAEQYLIRAEARAYQNKISEGLQDVNKIRNRAGLADTTATTKEQLLDIILQERQVELFAEYGHRWFDLKRTGKIDVVMNLVAPQKGTTWSSFKKFFPIPQREIDSNPNLTQNQGY